MQNDGFSMRRVRQIVKKLRIHNYDIILVKNGTPLAENTTLQSFVRMVAALKLRCAVVTVDEFDDIKTMSDEQLRQLGYIRKSTMMKVVTRRKEDEGE